MGDQFSAGPSGRGQNFFINYFTESSNAHLHCLSSSINLIQKDIHFTKKVCIKVINTCRCEGAPYNSILGVNKLFHVQGVCWYPWEGWAKLDKILEVMVISYSNIKNSLNENLLRWPNFQLSSCFCFYASQRCPSASKVELVFFWLQKLKLSFGQKFLKVWTTCDLVWSLQM